MLKGKLGHAYKTVNMITNSMFCKKHSKVKSTDANEKVECTCMVENTKCICNCQGSESNCNNQ